MSADLETRISQRLSGAGSALTASEWVLVHVGVVFVGGLVGLIMGGVPLSILGLILGIVLPWLYLKFRHGRRLSAFNGQLAQTLGLMAGGLQAGLSLPQAVDTVVREGHEPMSGELRRALVEQRLGVDITDALDGVAERMESDDFGWVVMAVRIQREVGGNLAEILQHGRRHAAGAGVPSTSGQGAERRGASVRLHPGRPAAGHLLLHDRSPTPITSAMLYTTVPGYIISGARRFPAGTGLFRDGQARDSGGLTMILVDRCRAASSRPSSWA